MHHAFPFPSLFVRSPLYFGSFQWPAGRGDLIIDVRCSLDLHLHPGPKQGPGRGYGQHLRITAVQGLPLASLAQSPAEAIVNLDNGTGGIAKIGGATSTPESFQVTPFALSDTLVTMRNFAVLPTDMSQEQERQKKASLHFHSVQAVISRVSNKTGG